MRGHTEGIEYLTFSPDSHILATSAWDGTVRLWSVAQPAQPGTVLEGMQGSLAGVSFAPGADLLATGADGGQVCLWTRTGTPIATLTSGLTDTTVISFSPDSRVFAASFSGDEAVIWSSADHSERARLRGHTERISDLVFSPNSQLLASSDIQGNLHLWDALSWNQIARVPGVPADRSAGKSHWIGLLAWRNDSQRLALWGESTQGAVQVWDIPLFTHTQPNQTLIPTWKRALLPAGFRPTVIRFSPNGRYLIVADYAPKLLPDTIHHVHIFDAETLAEVSTFPIPDHADFALSLAVSPDGRLLAIGGAMGMIWLWSLERQQLLASIAAHTESKNPFIGVSLYALGGLDWSPNGEWLATAGFDPRDAAHPDGQSINTAKLWRISDLKL